MILENNLLIFKLFIVLSWLTNSKQAVINALEYVNVSRYKYAKNVRWAYQLNDCRGERLRKPRSDETLKS